MAAINQILVGIKKQSILGFEEASKSIDERLQYPH